MGLDDLKAAWNAESDWQNKWGDLGIDEIVAFAMEQARKESADEIERLRGRFWHIKKGVEMALRWKKEPRVTGLMRVTAGPRGSKLHDGVTRYASVHCGENGEWFWSAPLSPGVPYKNPYKTPFASENEAKKAAEDYVKACRKAHLGAG